MLNRKLLFSGEEIDLSFSESDVKAQMQSALDKIYEGIIVVDKVETPDDLTFEMTILRGLPASKCDAIDGGWLSHFDESMITGLLHEEFMLDLVHPKKNNPMIYPIIPFGEAWWSPDTEFAKLYMKLNKIICNERIESVRFSKDTMHFNMRVVFKK